MLTGTIRKKDGSIITISVDDEIIDTAGGLQHISVRGSRDPSTISLKYADCVFGFNGRTSYREDKTAAEKATELGATDPESRGINWTWAHGFPTEDKAKEFVKFLDRNNYEHRGIYPVERHFDVRYREGS